MENIVFRQKLGLSLLRQLDNNGTTPQLQCQSTTARCLFGIPDPKQATTLVREIELKNALSFGSKFNFDIIRGEPFPACQVRKSLRSRGVPEQDQENMNIEDDGLKGGYMWTESYDEDCIAKWNSDKCGDEFSVIPSCSLLFAPISDTYYLPPVLSPSSTCSSMSPPPTHDVPIITSHVKSQESRRASNNSTSSNHRSSNSESSNNKKKSTALKKSLVKKWSHANKKNAQLSVLHPQGNQGKKSAKKSSLVQQIITKYTQTQRMVKHALRKPRKSPELSTTAV